VAVALERGRTPSRGCTRRTESRRCGLVAAATSTTGSNALMLDAPTTRQSEAEVPQQTRPSLTSVARPEVRGKFLFVGDEKYWVKGVTYGTFRPDAGGHAFPPSRQVERDFVQMVRAGINTVRIYTPAERWLLDLALQHGLRVMVGLP
jgi:hypothetical protein